LSPLTTVWLDFTSVAQMISPEMELRQIAHQGSGHVMFGHDF
jgi:hypothetical protein